MAMHIIMIIMMLTGASLCTFTQETPATEKQSTEQNNSEKKTSKSEEELLKSKEYQEFLKAQTALSESTAAPESEEFKTLEKDATRKQEAFEKFSTLEASQKEPQEPVTTETSPENSTTPENSSEQNTPAEVPAAPEPVAEPAIEYRTELPSLEEQEVIIPDEEPEKETPTGIDTVSLENPQGNWLFKRIWWERAEERYEKIRQAVDTIWESRTTFFIERNKLDRNVLDPFYINIGIDQGELQAILTEINDFIEKNTEKPESLTQEEEMLVSQEEALKQLKMDVEAIGSLDHSIDDALGKLMDQINRVRQYETESWDHFKEIAHMINDAKARELYYMIEGAARNIKNISTYLERDFFTHFQKLVSETTKHVSSVQSQIEALKEKGIRFQRQTEILEQQKQMAEQDDEEDENNQDVKPKPKLGWFGWIGSLFTNALSSVWSIIRMPYDMIFGK